MALPVSEPELTAPPTVDAPPTGRKLNVIFVVPRFHTNLYFATKALKQAGISVHLFCAKADGLEDHSEIRPRVLDQSALTWSALHKLIADIDPDLIVIRWVGKLSKMVHRVGLVQRRRMIGYDQRPYLRPRHLGRVVHGLIRGRPVRRMTPVHGLPQHGGRADPLATYIPFPVSAMAADEPRSYAPDGTVRILCVGKLAERRKNHLLLLEALEPLASEFDFRITLAGNATLEMSTADGAYLESLLSYKETGALRERLTILKNVAFNEMERLYSEHDICVLPSKKEPLGTAPLEAMGRGCAAIISSDSGSAYYVAASSEAGLPCGAIFATGSREALTAELLTLLRDPNLIARYGQNASEWVRREFSLDTFARRFHGLLKTKA